MGKFNVHGWEHLSGDKPVIVAAREEISRQLEAVPECHKKTWAKRLKSKQDHPHFSVRLELYLHHFFKERGWEIDIEPKLPGTTNKPDFLLRHGECEMLVEAKTLLDPEPVAQQDERLKGLADGLTKKLKRKIHIHPYFDLPPVNLPYRRIATEIEKRVSDTVVEKWKSGRLLQEFLIEGEHQAYKYSLEVTIIPSLTAGIGGWVSQVYEDNTGERMREAILEKAAKYGKPTIPFVIAIWPQVLFYSSHDPYEDDYVALVGGDEFWTMTDFVPQFRFNGVFYIRNKDSSRRYSHVSAVAIYLFKHDWNPPHTGRSSLRVYHNPFADFPINTDVFRGEGIRQGVINLDTDKMQWI